MSAFSRNRFLLILSDALNFACALLIGSLFQPQFFTLPSILYGGMSLGLIMGFWLRGHYTRRVPFWDELRQTLQLILMGMGIHAFLIAAGHLMNEGLNLLFLWGSVMCLIPLGRVCLKRILLHLGLWQRPVLLIGCGENAREALAAFESEDLMGYAFIGAVKVEAREEHTPLFFKEHPLKIFSQEEAKIQMQGPSPPHLVMALEDHEFEDYGQYIQQWGFLCSDMNVVPPLRGLPLHGMALSHFFSHEVLLIHVRNNLQRFSLRVLKRCLDILGALTIGCLISPLLLWIMLSIKRQGGAVFYAHTRIGRNGVPFPCYKFCSMVPNAQAVLEALLAHDPEKKAEWERDFKLKDDPRITPIGHFLRKTSLDELPQLWNVLKGDMSLVGPRPIIEAELVRYGEAVGYYLEARPGMTGLWQISGRNHVDYTDRVALDVWYVRNWSPWYDLIILFKTIGVVLKRQGAY